MNIKHILLFRDCSIQRSLCRVRLPRRRPVTIGLDNLLQPRTYFRRSPLPLHLERHRDVRLLATWRTSQCGSARIRSRWPMHPQRKRLRSLMSISSLTRTPRRRHRSRTILMNPRSVPSPIGSTAAAILVLMANNTGNCEFDHLNMLATRFGITFNGDSRNDSIPDSLYLSTLKGFPGHPLFAGD